MLREGKWLCEGDYIARVFDEGNFVAKANASLF
jgi:hypothetical protein